MWNHMVQWNRQSKHVSWWYWPYIICTHYLQRKHNYCNDIIGNFIKTWPNIFKLTVRIYHILTYIWGNCWCVNLIFKRFSANGSQTNYKHNQVTDNRMIPYLNMIVLAAIVTRKSCLKSFKVETITQLIAQWYDNYRNNNHV